MGRIGLVNLWLSATDSEYHVPATSTWLGFVPTVMNAGSGGWWIYGEDAEHYYHHAPDGTQPYRAIRRQDAQACAGFDAHRVDTWCAGAR